MRPRECVLVLGGTGPGSRRSTSRSSTPKGAMLCLNGFRHERFEPRRLNECVPETIRLNSRSHTCQAEPGTPSHEAEPVSAWPTVGFETAHESKQLHSLQAAAHNQAIPHNTSISLRKSCNSGLSDALPRAQLTFTFKEPCRQSRCARSGANV